MAREKPNFWSSCAVAMNSWVCASMPTVVRMSSGTGDPPAATRAWASGTRRSISSNESTTTWPMPASTASRSSTSDLLLPCSAIRSAGKPAASATASSLPLQASRCSPSSAIQRATCPHRNALEA